jgi:hypothetical protein
MTARRGAAMLLVLMTCTVLIVGVTLIARAQSSAAITTDQASKLLWCDQLISASELPILHWLEERSSGITLDPSLDAPVLRVHDNQLRVSQSLVQVQITAWDQQGMWPNNSESMGLQPRIEVEHATQATIHLGHHNPESVVYPTASEPAAIGGLLATHNPWPIRPAQTRRRAAVAINVNTAPQLLLNQLGARYNLGDLGVLIDNRNRSEFVAMSQSARNEIGEEIRLVSVSRVWAFRTDVRVDHVTRSAWSVYANQGGQWQLVQRTVISEPSN